MAYAKIMPRRGTSYDWNTINPVLAEGELAIEVPDSGVGTGFSKFKIGDGVTPWDALPYAFDGSAASSIDGGSPTNYSIIQLRRASASVWESENPILNIGEPGYDTTNHALKFGDGVTAWNNLTYEKALVIKSKTSSTNCLDETVLMDFGDEDAVSVSQREAYVLDNTSYPDHILPSSGGVQMVPNNVVGTANLNDLLNTPSGVNNAALYNSEIVEVDENAEVSGSENA